jgi:hypothetical protein
MAKKNSFKREIREYENTQRNASLQLVGKTLHCTNGVEVEVIFVSRYRGNKFPIYTQDMYGVERTYTRSGKFKEHGLSEWDIAESINHNSL